MRAAMVLLPLVGIFLGAPANAQQTVPDAMPFDVPYGLSITAERAAEVVRAVIAEATRAPRDWKLAIAVVDTSGELVYFYRMDQTQQGSNQVAVGKARTAARFRRATQVFFELMQTPAGSYVPSLDPTLIASPGGVPLVENGRLIGAIGCSGAAGAQDHVACSAGAATLR